MQHNKLRMETRSVQHEVREETAQQQHGFSRLVTQTTASQVKSKKGETSQARLGVGTGPDIQRDIQRAPKGRFQEMFQ